MEDIQTKDNYYRNVNKLTLGFVAFSIFINLTGAIFQVINGSRSTSSRFSYLFLV